MNWREVCESPYLRDLPFKIELNHWGQVIMSPATNMHSVLQGRIQRKLFRLTDGGEIMPECSVQTSDNVKVADVAWISEERYRRGKREIAYSLAPEVCVEVRSASNTKKEMLEKRDLYLEAGALEVWICDKEGEMTFYGPEGELDGSRMAPGFANRIPID